MPNLGYSDILELSKDLPQISAASIQITSMIDNPNTSRESIVNLIKADPMIFAECFKQANSVAIASTREYKTIDEIVNVLGFSHIKKVCLFLAAKSIIKDPKIWFESVFMAVSASYLARKSGMSTLDSDRVYMAALLINFGSFVLNQKFPSLYAKASQSKDFRLRLQSEHTEFGCTYLDVSAITLEKYNVPSYIIEIIKKQKDLYIDKHSKDNALIEIARIICNLQDLDFEALRDKLDLGTIQSLAEEYNVNLNEFDENSFKKIKIETQEFSYRK